MRDVSIRLLLDILDGSRVERSEYDAERSALVINLEGDRTIEFYIDLPRNARVDDGKGFPPGFFDSEDSFPAGED